MTDFKESLIDWIVRIFGYGNLIYWLYGALILTTIAGFVLDWAWWVMLILIVCDILFLPGWGD